MRKMATDETSETISISMQSIYCFFFTISLNFSISPSAKAAQGSIGKFSRAHKDEKRNDREEVEINGARDEIELLERKWQSPEYFMVDNFSLASARQRNEASKKKRRVPRTRSGRDKSNGTGNDERRAKAAQHGRSIHVDSN